jgi:hypothetical protein
LIDTELNVNPESDEGRVAALSSPYHSMLPAVEASQIWYPNTVEAYVRAENDTAALGPMVPAGETAAPNGIVCRENAISEALTLVGVP